MDERQAAGGQTDSKNTHTIITEITSFEPILPPIQGSDIATELRVVDKAMQAGRNNLPKTDGGFDEPQQAILKTVRELLNKGRNNTIRVLEALQQRREHLALAPTRQKLRDAKNTIKINVERVKAEHRDRLIDARTRERRQLRNLKYFERTNDIHHEARYPESKVYHWSILAAMVLAESILNSYFFSLASDLGLLGGVFQAILISLVNIGLAIFAGEFGLRQLNHISPTRKAFGSLVLSIYLAIMTAFNLATAHYRALLEEDPLTALRLVLSRVMKTPFGFDNFDAVILLLMGIMFSLAALYKTYKADDPYPGYGAMHRRYIDAREDYEASKGAFRADINGTIDEGRIEVGRIIQEARSYVAAMPENIRNAEAVIDDYKRYVVEGEATLKQLLELYRAKNADIRTSRPPAHFNEFPESGISRDLPDTGVSSAKERLPDFQKLMEDTEKEYDGAMANFKSVNERAIKEAAEFIGEIESEAEERLQEEERMQPSDPGPSNRPDSN